MRAALARMHEEAVAIADRLEEAGAALGTATSRLPNGTRLIDAGVQARGSCGAGRLFAEACLGGMGAVATATRRLGRATILEARVVVDAPLLACIGSQYAGWKIQAAQDPSESSLTDSLGWIPGSSSARRTEYRQIMLLDDDRPGIVFQEASAPCLAQRWPTSWPRGAALSRAT